MYQQVHENIIYKSNRRCSQWRSLMFEPGRKTSLKRASPTFRKKLRNDGQSWCGCL